MKRSRQHLPVLAGAIVLASVAIACGGGSGPQPAATASPRFKVTSLESLNSYRFTSEIRVSADALDGQSAQLMPQGGTYQIKTAGVRVNPDRQQSTIDADLGFLKANLETVSIAKEQWSREPQGQWQRGATGAAALLATSDFSPQGLFSGATAPTSEQLTQRLEGRPFTNETLGGVAARRYVFDRAAFEAIFGTQSAVPASADDVKTQADVWFGEERGVILRILIVGTNGQQKEVLHVDVQVSDIDAASNKVAPPI